MGMKKILSALLLFFALSSFAQELKVEPVYSVETTYRQYPEPPKQVTRTYLGLSATYGTPKISAEFEVSQSTDTDTFPADNAEATSIIRRALLGARFYPITSQYVGFFVRGGVRAKQETLDIKENGQSREEELPVYIDPYAGAGLTLALAQNFALNGSATMIYNNSADVEASEKYDVQYSLSATVRFGNR